MTKQLLTIATYLGAISGTAGLAGLLILVTTHYPTLAENQWLFYAPITFAWFVLALFILNKAYDDESAIQD